MRFLEPRARSVTEVRRRLTGAGYRTDLVEGAIDRLLDLGVLDDEAFARAWVDPRPGAAPRRARDPPGAGAQGRRPDDRGSRPGRAPRGRGRDRGRRRCHDVAGPGGRRTTPRAECPRPGARRRSGPASPAGVRPARPQRLRSRDVPVRGGGDRRPHDRGRRRRVTAAAIGPDEPRRWPLFNVRNLTRSNQRTTRRSAPIWPIRAESGRVTRGSASWAIRSAIEASFVRCLEQRATHTALRSTSGRPPHSVDPRGCPP